MAFRVRYHHTDSHTLHAISILILQVVKIACMPNLILFDDITFFTQGFFFNNINHAWSLNNIVINISLSRCVFSQIIDIYKCM